MPKQSAMLAYSQIREYEEAEKKNDVIEAIYKAIANLAKAMVPRKK